MSGGRTSLNVTLHVVPADPDRTSASFEELARENGTSISRLLSYLGVPSRDVEDALQDVFLIAHRRLAEMPELMGHTGWLRGVAINVARNRRRTGRRSRVAFVNEPPDLVDEATPEQAAMNKREAVFLLELLEKLPEEHRTVIVLFEIEGLPMKQIAEIEGIALATAYSHLHKGRAALKQEFERQEGGDESR